MDDIKLTGVVVTTAHRGVFFGYVPEGTQPKEQVIELQRARNCLYWSDKLRGFLGLASAGPNKQSKVGPAVSSLVLTEVTSVATCTPEAVAAWELAPWGA